MTRGTVSKKLRQLIRRQELALSEQAYQEFKLWCKTRRLHQRLVIAWKILRQTFVFLLVLSAQAYAMTGEELDLLTCKIIQAESSGHAGIIGDEGRARGLGQIQKSAWKRLSGYPWADAFNPEKNRQVTRKLVEEIATHYELIGLTATAKKVIFTYNTGRYEIGSLPRWTKRHPNDIYRKIFNGR